MHSSSVPRGQSALEYLFLLAGGVIIVIIILLSVIGLTPLGQSFLGANIQEYEEIDLCTGKTADCSLQLDWGAGVQTDPVGVRLTNTTWRDLYIDGIGTELNCYTPAGFVPCTLQNNFFNNSLQVGFLLPVQSGTCTDVSANPGTTPPVWDCSGVCDPNVTSASCVQTLSVPFCFNPNPAAACTNPVSDLSLISPAPSAGFILKSGESRELGLLISGDLDGKGNSKNGHISLRVTQAKPLPPAIPGGPTTYELKANTTGIKRTNALGYYSSWNYYTGSFRVCQNLDSTAPGTAHDFYWCDLGLGTPFSFAGCGYDSSLGSPAVAQAYFTNPVNRVFDFANDQGEVVHIDVSPLASSGLVAGFTPQISLKFSNFDNPSSPCWQGQPNLAAAQNACNAVCTAYLGGVIPNLRFYRIAPTTPTSAWCDKLANASSDPAVTLITASLIPASPGSTNPGANVVPDSSGAPIGANCGATFALPSLTGINTPQNYFVGVRLAPGVPSLPSYPQANSILRGHWGGSPIFGEIGTHVGAFTLNP
ncbi:MAG: hypothetical protein IPJ89_00470 [Candidatus Iainarchaeum archaeon]|uniref:Class III signal peptide-containing protein n=1 Tax=Candidatus Iainarchaeum sp. TaxID=3101447 RepID=A0A7T9I1R9_9ARCH|nr:MAG: hypothetical protein IPJ89_00470 [Candidatus Diapherotrites archaeon]